MSVKLKGKLTDPLSTEIFHESGANIKTTAPKDHEGTGALFSPTDLLAAALGSCVLTVLSIYAKKHNIQIDHAEFELEKEMNPTPPRRVKRIAIVFKIKTSIDQDAFEKLKTVAKTCPVGLSLHPEIELVETFERI